MRCITIAEMPFDAEKMHEGVRTVARSFGVSASSPGPLPRAWPIARLNTTLPWRRRQNRIVG